MKYLFYLTIAALTLGACGSSTETETVEDVDLDTEVAAPVGTMPGAEGVSINETVDAVRNAGGDITAIPPGAAVGVIDGWIAKLSGTPGATNVVNGLQSLKAELTSGNIDGNKVGGILNNLATETRSMAPNNMALGNLASALEAGGQKLGGM